MFNRLRNKIYLDNPLKTMVKEELAYEFDVATYMAGLLLAEYGICLLYTSSHDIRVGVSFHLPWGDI